MTTCSTVYIGLGSNLDNPIYQIQQALLALDTLPITSLSTHSALYQSTPLGPQNQPDYINAVAVLITKLPPLILLTELQTIENKQGRIRHIQRWGPRTLDLDILLYDNKQLQNTRLTLPHPGVYERAFVLYPLCECAPDLVLPDGQRVYDLMLRCSAIGIKRLK
ncbi:2-amino-4-hydroxy-6-hydroxymethyldihydropteridine diphosphokinase [Candidatus Parabeggiatoa sp. HSG14]|uniref:2-amino-4-hydroxy-6- hydroxymethyldihydropteridine diphosphokinase n=1 Tax=Candidatus Parabeggiatoa sp. HSG14 TaxID=3055593 RepID=UPI0025A81F56|nr:2-amino-4-hydroxy-6-hydroxymethyldihydropteridine diphosphokinase [Thiotrichales bacterium HSG14]